MLSAFTIPVRRQQFSFAAASYCWRSKSPGHHGARQEEGQGAAGQEEAQEPDQGQHDRRAEGGDQDQGEVQRAA